MMKVMLAYLQQLGEEVDSYKRAKVDEELGFPVDECLDTYTWQLEDLVVGAMNLEYAVTRGSVQ